ncbi:GNAT family N-acetyltransferase [Pseudomonadota bacterium]
MEIKAPCPISDKHDASTFDCGHATLNDWLQKRAIKNEGKGASRTFVVCKGNTIIGYYSLAVGAVTREEASNKVRRNMLEPIPVMVLGRLAVDTQWQDKDLGVGMLKDAIMRTLIVAEQAGIRAILVNTLTEEAKHFYLHCGFHEPSINDMTLMVTLSEVRKVFDI